MNPKNLVPKITEIVAESFIITHPKKEIHRPNCFSRENKNTPR